MRSLGAVCALSLFVGSAVAGPITWVASGTIGGTANSSGLPLDPQLGDAFTYTITFDNETPDTSEGGSGNFPGAILSSVFTIGGNSVELPVGPGSLAYTYNDSNSDYYQLSFQTQSVPWGTYPNLVVQFGLSSTSPLAFDTDALPTAPPTDLSIYQVSFYILEYQSAESTSIPFVYGGVTSIVQQEVSVPEPATMIMLATGLMGIGLARRRKQARR